MISKYEQNQNFNRIVSYLHSFRYKHIRDVAQSLQPPIRVLDVGCAFCKLYEVLDRDFTIDYTGMDIHPDYLNSANDRYLGRENFRTIKGRIEDGVTGDYDLIAALETLEHIDERLVVNIVDHIADLRPKVFVCSVPIEVGPIIAIKNLGSSLMGYSRHHEYSWRETALSATYQLDKIPVHGTKHKGFDWRWLAQTLRYRFHVRTQHFPAPFLPMGLSTSAFFVCTPR